jgi:hypothetical protein
LEQLISLETDLNNLYDEFQDAALYAVHFIVKNNIASLNLYNLYGDDGDKFMTGGLLVRRAKNWLVYGKHLSEEDSRVVKGAAALNLDVNQVVVKLAKMNVKALSMLRNKIKNLIIPMACIVDYFGIVF